MLDIFQLGQARCAARWPSRARRAWLYTRKHAHAGTLLLINPPSSRHVWVMRTWTLPDLAPACVLLFLSVCGLHVCTCVHMCATLHLCACVPLFYWIAARMCAKYLIYLWYIHTHTHMNSHMHTQWSSVLTVTTLLPITEAAVTLQGSDRKVLLSAHTPWFCTFYEL